MKNAKMFLGLALFSAALAGAFTTSASKARVANEPGYIKQGISCVYKNDCSTAPTLVLCTETNTGGSQIFGMDPSDCTVDLWRVH